MKKNESARVEITSMNDLGYGVGRIGEKVVFVKNGVTGDLLNVRIIKDGGSYFVALAEEILHASSLRQNACCADFPKCGGCAFRHISYDYEKELKCEFIASFLKKEGLSDITVLPVLSTGQTDCYRNKVQFPYRDGTLGYYAGHSHRVASGVRCPQHLPAMQRVLDALEAFLREYSISSYDEETGKGLLRHILLRSSADGRAMLLTLVLTARSFPRERELLALLQGFPEVKGLYYNVNNKNTNVILGDDFFHICGEKALTDTLLGCTFELSPASFYQVNHDACELLYSEVITRAGACAGARVVDLFCGAGTIGICLAKNTSVGRLVGIEIVPQAVENAKRNAARNGVTNADFFCGDANHPTLDDADVVIVDPPRKGLDEALIAHLSDLAALKKVIYVSCNPATLARDLARFRARGWTVGELQPVDMFPRTGHVECVTSLTRE